MPSTWPAGLTTKVRVNRSQLFSPETYFERNKGFAQQAGNRTRGGRRVTTRVGLCGSKGDACPPAEPTGWPTGRLGAEDLQVILRAPGTSRALDSRPPATDYQRGASAPPGGECRPTARPGTKLSDGTWGARSEFPGKKTEKDLRAEVPSAAEEAMAVGVWGWRLWRAAPGGGAGWSEF